MTLFLESALKTNSIKSVKKIILFYFANVKAAFKNVVEAETAKEVVAKLILRQDKLDTKRARDNELKGAARIKRIKI